MRRKHRPHGEDVEAIRRPRATTGLEFPLLLNLLLVRLAAMLSTRYFSLPRANAALVQLVADDGVEVLLRNTPTMSSAPRFTAPAHDGRTRRVRTISGGIRDGGMLAVQRRRHPGHARRWLVALR
ncbi:hypothetical protein RI054_38g143310 [Pseudoscourfieldia marina]